MRVIIARKLLDTIHREARGQQAEICGLLLGRPGRIESARAAANIAPDTSRHFELDPAVLLTAHREARGGGPAVLGHYHSHPSGIAVPSPTDAACAAPDGSLWLIVGNGEARLWQASGDQHGPVAFTEVSLDIE